jgi:hypothetical protein
MKIVDRYVRVEWTDLGEGVDGDYDPTNPEDVALLRFDISRWNGFDWEPVDDASYCTNVPASTDTDTLMTLLQEIMNEVGDDVRGGISIKKKCEGLSWLSA